MTAAKKKTAHLVEAHEIEDQTPPVPKVRSRPKSRAALAHAGELQEAIIQARQALLRSYETLRGISRGGLQYALTSEPALLFLDANMANYCVAFRDAETDEERLSVLQNCLRHFRKLARSMRTPSQIQRRKKLDELHGLAICIGLADPSIDTSSWGGRPRASELFPLDAELDEREAAEEIAAHAATAPVKLPVFVEPGTVPVMPGVLIDGLSKYHPMQPKPKASTVRRVGTAAPQPKVPLTGIDNCQEIDSSGQRTLRDAFGAVAHPRDGALGW